MGRDIAAAGFRFFCVSTIASFSLEPPGPEVLLFAAGGFAVAALFLVSLCLQVRRIVREGGMPSSMPLMAFGRIAIAAGLIGSMALCGAWPALGGIAGFIAGRVFLWGPVSRSILPPAEAGEAVDEEDAEEEADAEEGEEEEIGNGKSETGKGEVS